MSFVTVTAKGILETNLTNTDATEKLHYLRQLGPCSKIVPEIEYCLGYLGRWKVLGVQPKIQRLTAKRHCHQCRSQTLKRLTEVQGAAGEDFQDFLRKDRKN